MLRLLNGVKWFEWVLVGAVVLSSLLLYVGFQKYMTARDAGTVLTEQFSQLQRATEYQQRFYVRADQVVSDYVKAVVETREVQSSARETDIDAYFALAHPTPIDVPVSGVLPLPSIEDLVPDLRFEHPPGRNRPAVKPSMEPTHVPPTYTPANERVETNPLVIAALTDMANRMRTRACAAGAPSAACRP